MLSCLRISAVFAKLFHQVVYSSLTQKEPIVVRGVFFMLMAIADKGGTVLGTDEAIARIINVPMDEFSLSLTALMAPDTDSQSKDHEGRRVIRLQDTPGLFLVNYEKYAAIGSDEQRREYFRSKKAESRARLKQPEVPGLVLESETKPVESKAWEPTQTQTRLGRLFKRRPGTKWDQKEIKALKDIGEITDEDLNTLETYYTARHKQGEDYRRRDLATLLNNFNGELDRARKYKPTNCF